MKQALRVAATQLTADRRARRDLASWAWLLPPVGMTVAYWGLSRLPLSWASAVFLNGQPFATFLLLGFGLGGALAVSAAGLRLFGVKEPGLLQTLPIPPAVVFGGLALGQLVGNGWSAATFVLPALVRLGALAGATAAAGGLAGAVLGYTAGTAAGLGLIVLVTRYLRPLWLARWALTAVLGGGPVAAVVGGPAYLPAWALACLVLAVPAYAAGLRQYPLTYASYLGRAESRPACLLTYPRLRNVAPAPAGPVKGLAAKDLLMLARHPITPWRVVLFLASLWAFPWFRNLLAGRQVFVDPALLVAVYVGAAAALLLGLELYATAFVAETGRIALLLSSPLAPAAILQAKILANLTLPLAGTVVGVLVAGALAGLTPAGYLSAFLCSVPALVGAGVLMIGWLASTPEVGAAPEESPEALLLEQAPLGRGMVALLVGALLLSAEYTLLLWCPVVIPVAAGLGVLILAQIAVGWRLGLSGLRSLAR